MHLLVLLVRISGADASTSEITLVCLVYAVWSFELNATPSTLEFAVEPSIIWTLATVECWTELCGDRRCEGHEADGED